MMRIRLTLFILSLLVWFLLNWSFDAEHVIFGIAVGVVVALATGNVFDAKGGIPRILKEPGRILWLIYYLAVFAWECFKANLDGAWRVLHPDVPINPGIVKVKTILRSNIGLTFLANSLTLKPGTMTVDIDKENYILYVHWVDVKSQDEEKASELIVRRFENILKRIFE